MTVTLITGANKGLGYETARRLIAEGHTVYIGARSVEHGEAAASGLGGQFVRLDVTDDAAVAAALATIDEREGRLDVLVNNAGMSPTYDSVAEVTEELYDKTLAVNLKGPFRLSALAGTYMAAHDGGSVINVGSIGSQLASPRELPYACAKAGLNALTVGMAETFAPRVRVNAILPGAIRTDVSKSWTPGMLSGSTIPFDRIGEPEELAGIALYLASPAASYTTGAIIRVDGGAARQV